MDASADPQCGFAPDQPPASTREIQGSPVAVLERAIFWWPKWLKGWEPFLSAVSLTARRVTTNAYDATVAPEWFIGFLNPRSGLVPSTMDDLNTVPGGLVATTDAFVLFRRAALTDAVVWASANGFGYEWPRTNQRYWPLMVYARSIVADSVVGMAIMPRYRRIDFRPVGLELP